MWIIGVKISFVASRRLSDREEGVRVLPADIYGTRVGINPD